MPPALIATPHLDFTCDKAEAIVARHLTLHLGRKRTHSDLKKGEIRKYYYRAIRTLFFPLFGLFHNTLEPAYEVYISCQKSLISVDPISGI